MRKWVLFLMLAAAFVLFAMQQGCSMEDLQKLIPQEAADEFNHVVKEAGF